MSNKQPLVSVVLPCYNHEKYVHDALESILNQTFDNFEVIAFDHGSTDNSYEVMKPFADQGKITLIKLEENNLDTLPEIGLKYVRGKYVASATSDDIWEKDKLECQMKVFKEDEDIKACFTWASFLDCNNPYGINDNLFIHKNRSREEWIKRLLLKGNCLCFPSRVAETSFLKEFVCIATGYYQLEDFWQTLKILLNGKMHVIEKPLVKFRWHDNNMSKYSFENRVRTSNESTIIIKEIFEEMDDELFLSVFRNDLIDPKVSIKEEIMCERFFILLNLAQSNVNYQEVVMDYFYKNYHYINSEKNFAYYLKEKYNFGRTDFLQYSGKFQKFSMLDTIIPYVNIIFSNEENIKINRLALKKSIYKLQPNEVKDEIDAIITFTSSFYNVIKNHVLIKNEKNDIIESINIFTEIVKTIIIDIMKMNYLLDTESWKILQEIKDVKDIEVTYFEEKVIPSFIEIAKEIEEFVI